MLSMNRTLITLIIQDRQEPWRKNELHVQGYMFKPDEKDDLLKEKSEESSVYEVWQTCFAGHFYLANTDKEFNPKTEILLDKGHADLYGYFMTETHLENICNMKETGDWVRIVNVDMFDPEYVKFDDLPDHMFLTSWLAAGNVFTPSMPDRFEKWLVELGLSLNKRISIMNSVSLRGADKELFDSALKYHLEGMDERCRKKATKHYDEVRKWIEEANSLMRK